MNRPDPKAVCELFVGRQLMGSGWLNRIVRGSQILTKLYPANPLILGIPIYVAMARISRRLDNHVKLHGPNAIVASKFKASRLPLPAALTTIDL
jgi:hypothetical protein